MSFEKVMSHICVRGTVRIHIYLHVNVGHYVITYTQLYVYIHIYSLAIHTYVHMSHSCDTYERVYIHIFARHTCDISACHMGWLRSVGSIKL